MTRAVWSTTLSGICSSRNDRAAATSRQGWALATRQSFPASTSGAHDLPPRFPLGLAIPHDLYEAAEVDGASWSQKFRYITWPSMQTLYITCTLLSMIWTLGDFNSVYLLTGGGPADLSHVLATLGIRYLRLDRVDLSMATIVVALPLFLPLVYFMMKRLSR